MKSFLLLLCFICASAVYGSLYENCDALFSEFQRAHKLKYSETEKKSRNAFFCENMKKADELNIINGSPAFGVTKFADRSEKEFSALLGRKNHGKMPDPKITVREPKAGDHVNYMNWQERKVVTPVKNQGQCGSCWAHSAAEQIESQFALDGNALMEFSPQQIASCTTNCMGCGGGDTTYAYDYLMSLPTTEGLGSAAFAPYVQSMYNQCTDAACTEACSSIDVSALQTYEMLTGFYAQVTGYEYATTPCTGQCNAQNMTMLAQNIASSGPASICVDASSWNLYTGNGAVVAASTCKMGFYDLDHCVQLVGKALYRFLFCTSPLRQIADSKWETTRTAEHQANDNDTINSAYEFPPLRQVHSNMPSIPPTPIKSELRCCDTSWLR